MVTLDWILWSIAAFVGIIAAVLDWQSNQVPNKVWKLGAILASPFLLTELFTHPGAFFLRLLFAGIWGGVLVLLWKGNVFGGADAKGFALFGLLLSPVGYFNPHDAKFFPALDVLVTTILLAELLRVLTKSNKFPLFSASSFPLLAVPLAGGLAWWPILWLVRLFVH